MADSKTIISAAEEKMDMAIMYLDESLAHIRAGKADVRLLDGIKVDSYGSMVPINNVAAVTTPDARSIAIKPWDKSMFRVIEKAIIDSELGIMPENNGEIIRLGIPPLTEERRKQLAKQCKGEGETAKVSVRNARRDAIDALKKAVKDDTICKFTQLVLDTSDFLHGNLRLVGQDFHLHFCWHKRYAVGRKILEILSNLCRRNLDILDQFFLHLLNQLAILEIIMHGLAHL